MNTYSNHLYHPSSSMGGGYDHGINRDHYSRLYRLNEFDMASLGQMASQLQSIVPDPSMIAPMLTAAATGMVGNYATSKLGKINPLDKIESAVSRKLDNTRAGKWLNKKIDQASDFMDRKLGNTTGITPEMRSAIGSEVTSQLDARGIRAGSTSPTGGSSGPSPTPPSSNPPSGQPPTPPPSPPSGTTGGRTAANGRGRR